MADPGFCTDADVKTSVANSALSKLAANIAPVKWDNAVLNANQAAYDLIHDHWISQGYTAAQVAAWQSGRTYQLFMARYQALMDAMGDSENAAMEQLRIELDFWRGRLFALTILVIDDDVEDPDDITIGGVGHGDLSTARDLFQLDPDDARRGSPTEF